MPVQAFRSGWPVPAWPGRWSSARLKSFMMLMVLAAFVMPGAVPAEAASRAVQINATIQRPVRLVMGDGIDFGTIIASPTGGTVTMPPTSDLPTVNGVRVLQRTGHRGHFAFITRSLLGHQMIIPTQIQLFPTSGVGTPMLISNITLGGGFALRLGNNGRFLVLLPPGIYAHFFLGGTLAVGPNQAPGTYAGTYDVIVNNL